MATATLMVVIRERCRVSMSETRNVVRHATAILKQVRFLNGLASRRLRSVRHLRKYVCVRFREKTVFETLDRRLLIVHGKRSESARAWGYTMRFVSITSRALHVRSRSVRSEVIPGKKIGYERRDRGSRTKGRKR